MPLNIKNSKVERLIERLSGLTGETKTEAVRRAVEERLERLAFRAAGDDREARLRRFLTQEVCPLVTKTQRGRTLSRAQVEALLGYGPEGA